MEFCGFVGMVTLVGINVCVRYGTFDVYSTFVVYCVGFKMLVVNLYIICFNICQLCIPL